MPDDLFLGEEVRQYLIDNDVVSAHELGEATPPPCMVDPREGITTVDVPPGATAVVAVETGMELPQPWMVGDFWQQRAVEVLVRSKSRPQAELICRQIRGLLEEKENLMMGRLLVDSSKLWRGVQPIHADTHAWTLTQSFLVGVSIRNLAV